MTGVSRCSIVNRSAGGVAGKRVDTAPAAVRWKPTFGSSSDVTFRRGLQRGLPNSWQGRGPHSLSGLARPQAMALPDASRRRRAPHWRRLHICCHGNRKTAAALSLSRLNIKRPWFRSLPKHKEFLLARCSAAPRPRCRGPKTEPLASANEKVNAGCKRPA